jgi:hypothetical protein
MERLEEAYCSAKKSVAVVLESSKLESDSATVESNSHISTTEYVLIGVGLLKQM